MDVLFTSGWNKSNDPVFNLSSIRYDPGLKGGLVEGGVVKQEDVGIEIGEQQKE